MFISLAISRSSETSLLFNSAISYIKKVYCIILFWLGILEKRKVTLDVQMTLKPAVQVLSFEYKGELEFNQAIVGI